MGRGASLWVLLILCNFDPAFSMWLYLFLKASEVMCSYSHCEKPGPLDYVLEQNIGSGWGQHSAGKKTVAPLLLPNLLFLGSFQAPRECLISAR